MTQKPIQVVHYKDITEPDQGNAYLHCAKCLDEKPDDVSPRDWARQQVALTTKGIQVWCTRHDVNIDHMEIRLRPDDE